MIEGGSLSGVPKGVGTSGSPLGGQDIGKIPVQPDRPTTSGGVSIDGRGIPPGGAHDVMRDPKLTFSPKIRVTPQETTTVVQLPPTDIRLPRADTDDSATRMATSEEPASPPSPPTEIVRASAIEADPVDTATVSDSPSLAVQKSLALGEGATTTETPFTRHEPISLKNLTGNDMPPRDGFNIEEELDTYRQLYEDDVHIFSRTIPEGEERIIVGPKFDGLTTNACLHFAATAKGLGLDSDDVIKDRNSLLNPKSEEGRLRLERHREITGWNDVEEGMGPIYDIIERNYDPTNGSFDQKDPDDFIRPVLRVTTTPDGQHTINLGQLDDDLRGWLAQEMQISPEQLNSALGPPWLAAFSPNEAQWLEEVHYPKEIIESRNTSEKESEIVQQLQFVGPSQVTAYAHHMLAQAQNHPGSVPRSRDLQRSPLLDRFVEYAAVQKLPAYKRPPRYNGTEGVMRKVIGSFAGVDLSKIGEQMSGDDMVTTDITSRYDVTKFTHNFIASNREFLATRTYQIRDGRTISSDYVLISEPPDQPRVFLSFAEQRGSSRGGFGLSITNPDGTERRIGTLQGLTHDDRDLIKNRFGINI